MLAIARALLPPAKLVLFEGRRYRQAKSLGRRAPNHPLYADARERRAPVSGNVRRTRGVSSS